MGGEKAPWDEMMVGGKVKAKREGDREERAGKKDVKNTGENEAGIDIVRNNNNVYDDDESNYDNENNDNDNDNEKEKENEKNMGIKARLN